MRAVSRASVRHLLVSCGAAVLMGSGVVTAQQASSPPAQPSAAQPPASAASPEQAAAPPASTPDRPPLPNRANEALPSWLRVRGEFRERVEGFANAGFVPDRDDTYFLSRLRLSAVATGRHIAATVQAEDARVAGKRIGPSGAPFSGGLDLRQAFVEIGEGRAPVAARVGRQEIAFGDQRLVGHAAWLNTARTFDAGRVIVRTRPAQIDLFAASVVRVLPGEFDRSGNGNRFAGVHVSTRRLLPQATLEPYVFYRRDVHQRAESGAIGSLAQLTTGSRLAGALPGRLDYTVEMDVQRGSLGPDAIRAWAGHWQLRKTLAGGAAPHVTGEYNYASGDRDPADGVRGTFDQLYPTAHDKYGLADQVGWRNIHHVRAGFGVTPFTSTPITVNYHSYWLAERRDALYAASGLPLARVPTGAASRRVGQEIDVQISRPLFPQLAVTAGYSHLIAGPFLREATPGASYSGPFVMATYVFLAEK